MWFVITFIKYLLLMKTFKRKLKLLSVLLFLSSIVLHAEEYQVRMAFIGNSITQGVYGYGTYHVDSSYATKFGILMEAVYGDTLDIYNAGVSGRCMLKDGPSPIWNESVFKTALNKVPDICFILLGTNDSKPSLLDDVKDHFYADYVSMIDTFKFRNPDTKFIICDPTPIWDGHPYSTSDPHNDTILVNYTIPLIDSVAKQTGAYLLDLHTPFVDSLQYFDDKLHPNPAGHRKMAQIIFDTIQKIDLLHSVEAGKTFIVTFKQATSKVTEGDSVLLSWTTLYADSVFLDDVYVGEDVTSTKIIAVNGETHTLKAKNDKNTSEYSITIKANAVSISETLNGNDITVFPNPVSETLNIQLDNESISDLHIKIYNSTGKYILGKNILNTDNSGFELDVSQFTNGTYIIGVYRNNNVSYTQFVKE